MKEARLTYLLGLLLAVIVHVPCYSQNVTIFPRSGPTITIPSMSFELTPGQPLVCALELTPGVNYTTRWTLPGGEMVNSSRGRFVFVESPVMIDSRIFPATTLVVTMLSYQDAGTYTCEGRSTASGDSTQWASASFELQLNLELVSNSSTVNATRNDSTISLHCEMRAYIRPDSSLVWEDPGGQTITGGMGKYQITFSDGSPNAAADGSGVFVPSRVSTLTIINPEPSDAGTYTCSVMGVKDVVVTFDLLVDGLRVSPIDEGANDNHTLQMIGIVLGSISAVILILAGLLAVAICVVVHAQKKSRKVQVSSKDVGVQQPVYDYIDLPELDNDNRRYSGLPDRIKQNEISYKDDPNADIYEEIRDTRERDDTYDIIKDTLNVNTTGMTIDSEMSGVYEVPMDGRGKSTLVIENEAIAVTTSGTDTVERNIVQDDNADALVDNDSGHTSGSVQ